MIATLALAWLGTAASEPREYLCFRTDTAPTIDGNLSDAAWSRAPWSEEFVDIEGDRRPKPRFRTRVKMLWDDRCLYIGADLEEPHVWATLTRRDSVIFEDNDFEVFLDPDGDNHRYYELELNANNTLWDLLLVKPYRDGGPAVFHWDFRRIRTAVHVDGTLNDPADTDRGWTLEIAIPWNDLYEHQRQLPQDDANPPTPWRPQEGATWRVNFSRVEWDATVRNGRYAKVPGRPEHNWVWSPQGVIDMHRPEKWGYVQFTSKSPVEATFVPDPSKQARQALMRFYELSHEFRKRHGRWPRSAREAGLRDARGLRVFITPSLFEAQLETRYPDGSTHIWAVTQDSRLFEVLR
ncbi:MAG: carbohydrate-binding family 9-like protein [Fimbriimonadales bacterium]|nr:carbohydrate-binding family 9-like protein [Fimbriimonadales bacterium]